jgi:hypothetical protein
VSSPLAIGAVSAVLRNLLDNGLINALPAPQSPVKVTAVAPDTIKLDDPEAPPSLNLFLYRTSRNTGWAELGQPAYDGNGTRLANPGLALNLHYLLTAYAGANFQAEILLGYAMHLLHERPVLDRAAIRRALDPTALDQTILPPAFQALTAADLADQLEAVTITDEPMNTEEMSRLWSAIQSHYRPTAAYVVTVVLIEARKPSRTPLPVLTRGGQDLVTGDERGVVVEPSLMPPYPTIENIELPPGQPAAQLGDSVRVAGHHLNGTSTVVRFAHRLLEAPHEFPIGANDDRTGIDVDLPSDAVAEEEWPAGVYTVTATLVRPGDPNPVPRESNLAVMLLAPEPRLQPPPAITRDADDNVTVTLHVEPRLRPEQEARLTLGGHTALADPIGASPSSTLTFELGDVPSGQQWVRLTVDGVESLLVDRSTEPPSFDPSQQVAVPA